MATWGLSGLSPIVTQKLQNPALELSKEESIICLNDCIIAGGRAIDSATGKDLVVVLGNTGAGKSTFVNFLHGCRLEAVRRADLGLGGGGRIVRVCKDSPISEVMTIGHTNKSQTFMPTIAPASPDLGHAFAYADCPGFLDNRGAEVNVANAVNVKRAISSAKTARVVVLIDYYALHADRGRGVQELCTILIDLFGGKDILTRFKDSVLILVSRAPVWGDYDGDLEPAKSSTEKVLDTSGLGKDEALLITSLAECVGVFDALDTAHSSWLKRAAVLSRIKHLKPIAGSDLEQLFKTVLTARDTLKLQSIVRDMLSDIRRHVESRNWDVAACTFGKMKLIDVVDNPEVTRMLADARVNIETSFSTIQQQALVAINKCNLEEAVRLIHAVLTPAAQKFSSTDKGLGQSLARMATEVQKQLEVSQGNAAELRKLREQKRTEETEHQRQIRRLMEEKAALERRMEEKAASDRRLMEQKAASEERAREECENLRRRLEEKAASERRAREELKKARDQSCSMQ